MEVTRLPNETAAHSGFNYKVVITHADLTETTADTDQTIQVASAGVGAIVRNVATFLKTDFQDASDSALNDTAIIVGDGNDTDRYILLQQVNTNGTEVDAAISPSTGTLPYVYTTADSIDVVVASMGGKSLSNIDTGEVWVFLDLVETSEL